MSKSKVVAGTFTKTSNGGWMFQSAGCSWLLPAGAVPRFNQFVRELDKQTAFASSQRERAEKMNEKADA